MSISQSPPKPNSLPTFPILQVFPGHLGILCTSSDFPLHLRGDLTADLPVHNQTHNKPTIVQAKQQSSTLTTLVVDTPPCHQPSSLPLLGESYAFWALPVTLHDVLRFQQGSLAFYMQGELTHPVRSEVV